jgi:hypothetical protein
MALTELQLEAYTDTINVYRKVRSSTSGENIYSATPHIAALACMLQEVESFDKLNADPTHNHRGSIGKTKVMSIFTMHRLYFEVDEDIIGQDLVEVLTAGHPDLNKWFLVMGNKKSWITAGERDANYAKVFLNATGARPTMT